MKQNNKGMSARPSMAAENSATVKTHEKQPQGLISGARILMGFALLLSLQLLSGIAHATSLPTLSFSCSLPKTSTASCVAGYFATFGTTSTNYWQYTVSTAGYAGIQMSFNTSASGTGPHTGTVQYSTDGTTFTTATTYTITGTGCQNKTVSLPAACNNQATLYVRLVMSGGTGTSGTNRVDSTGGFTGTAAVFCNTLGSLSAGSISGSPALICGTSGSSTLTDVGSSAAFDLQYAWSDGSGIISGATSTAFTTPTISSTTTYSFTVTCPSTSATATVAYTLSVNPVPATPTISGVPSPVLFAGSTATLSGTPTGGTWSSSNTAVGTIDAVSGVLGGIAGGATTVSYTITSGGCNASNTAGVNVVWAGDLALYAGTGGTSTSVTTVSDVSSTALDTANFDTSNTPCTTGGLSGLTVPSTTVTYSASGPHVFYTITPSAGNVLNVFQFHVSSRSSGTGPRNARLAYSLDGGTTWIDEGVDHVLSTSGSCGAFTNNWYWTPSAAINGATSLTVGIFPYNPTASTGTFQLQQLEIQGVVSSSVTCTGTPAAGVVTPSVTVACVSGFANLTFAPGSTGSGISYNWQQSTDGGATWSNISGASNAYYVSPSFTYSVNPVVEFQVVTTCANGGATNTSSIATLSVNPLPSVSVASGSISPLSLSSTATLNPGSPAGGTWSIGSGASYASLNTSTLVITPSLPGTTVIDYTVPGFGCVTHTPVFVAADNSFAWYAGTDGNSTAVSSLAGIATSSLTATGFGTPATACGNGGLSGLTVPTIFASYATSDPNVVYTASVTAVGGVTVNGIHATVRRSSTGAANFRIAYSADGGPWIDNGSDLSTDNLSCDANTTDNVFSITPFTAANTIQVGLFFFNAAASTGTVQVNGLDVTGSSCAAATAIQDVTNAQTLDGHTYGPACVISLSSTPDGGIWTSSDPTNATLSPTTGSSTTMTVNGGISATEAVTITYTNACGTSSNVANITLDPSDLSCAGFRHSAQQTASAVTNMEIYPNPANATLYITAAKAVNVFVMSMDGRTLMQQNNTNSIDVSNLASGLYLIKVYDNNDVLVKTAKFTKE